MKQLCRLFICLWCTSCAAADPAEAPSPMLVSPDRGNFQLSGDGEFVYYLNRTLRTLNRIPTQRGVFAEFSPPVPTVLPLRPAERSVTTEVVLPWESEKLTYQTTADGNVVAVLEKSPDGRPQLLIYRLGKDGAVAHPVRLEANISAFDHSNSGPLTVLTQSPSALFQNDIDLDSLKVVQRKLAEGVGGIVFGPNNRPRLLQVLSKSGLEWREVDSATAAMDVSRTGALKILGAHEKQPVLNWLGRPPGTDLTTLFEFDWRTGKHRTIGIPTNADIEEVLRDPQTGQVQAFVDESLAPVWRPISSSVSQELSFLSSRGRGFPMIAGRSADDQIWLIRFVSPEFPDAYAVFHRTARTFLSLPGISSALDDLRVIAPVVHRLKAADGQGLVAMLSPPQRSACDRTARDCPLVVLIHGGPGRRDRWAFDPELAWLQLQGYWVLRVNYRGSAGYGEKFERSLDRHWGTMVAADLKQAIDWATAQRGVQKKGISAFGGSFGGFAALALASHFPKQLQCAASLNGGGDLQAFAELLPQRQPKIAATILLQVGDSHSAAGRDLIAKQSPLSHIDRIKARLLIAYGSKDTVSAPEESSNFLAALAKTRRQFVGLAFADEGHELAAPVNREFFYTSLGNFLAQCSGRSARRDLQVPATVKLSGDKKLIQ